MSDQPGTDWTMKLIGLIFALVLMAALIEAFVDMLIPLLPWIGLSLTVFAIGSLWLRRRDRW